MTKYAMISAIVIFMLGMIGTGAKVVWDYERDKSAKIEKLTKQSAEDTVELKYLRDAYGKCEEDRPY